jgi:hypothetical protein
MAVVWSRLLPARCQQGLTADQQRLISLLKAVSERSASRMADEAEGLMEASQAARDDRMQYLAGAFLLGKIASGQSDEAVRFMKHNAQSLWKNGRLPLQQQWLYAIAVDRTQKMKRTGTPRARP